MREEDFCYKKPRYSEVRVITRRVIARYDCICKHSQDYEDTAMVTLRICTCGNKAFKYARRTTEDIVFPV